MIFNQTNQNAGDVNNSVDASPQPFVDVVFDGPPGPVCGRFVECDDGSGKSVNVGQWIDRGDGYWVLRIPSGRRLADVMRRLWISCALEVDDIDGALEEEMAQAMREAGIEPPNRPLTIAETNKPLGP